MRQSPTRKKLETIIGKLESLQREIRLGNPEMVSNAVMDRLGRAKSELIEALNR